MAAGQDAGWILVASKRMKNNHLFGDLKVGTLVDGFGRASDAPALVAAGINHLAETGADIIVANFSHAAWWKLAVARACSPALTAITISFPLADRRSSKILARRAKFT